MFLLPRLGRANLYRWPTWHSMPSSAVRSRTSASIPSLPSPRAPGVEARIKLPHAVAFVRQSLFHHLPGCRIQHRQCLLASVQITSYNLHLASFDPSAVRVNSLLGPSRGRPRYGINRISAAGCYSTNFHLIA